MRPIGPFLAILAAAFPGAAAAQSTLDQPPLLPETWTGIPWSLELRIMPVLARDTVASGFVADPSLRAALPLPRGFVFELGYAPQPEDTHGRHAAETALRVTPLRQPAGGLVDLALEARLETVSGTGAATVTAGRWLGPLRLLASARAFGGRGHDPRLAAGAGIVWHPAPGRLPIAIAGDATTVTDREAGERTAWSAGAHIGLPYTAHTLAVFATNAGTTLAGRASGTDRTRVGIQLTTHLPLGRVLGLYAPRDVAAQAVRTPQHDPTTTTTVAIREYRFDADRIEIPAGTAVRWINHDAVVHTASADDGAWGSGAIPHTQTWRAVFHEPGIYTYHCGPHPYMRGVIIVR
jgi:plastocyanin